MDFSVIMPVFNEEKTLKDIIPLVLQQASAKQLIVVDDGSTDESWAIIQELQSSYVFTALRHDLNRGKGSCLATAKPYITQGAILIQDADLEYHPKHYENMLRPIRDGRADVVYGSRFQTGDERRVVYYWHYLGNKFLTQLSNAVTNINLSDMETCYKAVRTELFVSLELKEKRFGIEPELTCKLASKKARFYEVSISYDGRTYDEGKKIRAKDGFRAIYCIFLYGLVTRKRN
jgi:glycosyltransferase involved in cell wall biosynthesis